MQLFENEETIFQDLGHVGALDGGEIDGLLLSGIDERRIGVVLDDLVFEVVLVEDLVGVEDEVEQFVGDFDEHVHDFELDVLEVLLVVAVVLDDVLVGVELLLVFETVGLDLLGLAEGEQVAADVDFVGFEELLDLGVPGLVVEKDVAGERCEGGFVVDFLLGVPLVVLLEVVPDAEDVLPDLLEFLADHLQEPVEKAVPDALGVDFVEVVEVVGDAVVLGEVFLVDVDALLVEEVVLVDFEDGVEDDLDDIEDPGSKGG